MPNSAATIPSPTDAVLLPDTPPPDLADGVELIGEYQGSGFEDPPYLARRRDGQVVQMKRLLFLVAEEIDGARGYEQIADQATSRYGVKLLPEQAHVLVERLRALGVVAGEDGETRELARLDPLLALKLRAAVVPARAVDRVSRIFAPLFLPTVVVLVLCALAALDVWLFGFHGIAHAVRDALYQPALLLLTLALVVLSTAFHECGHAAACRYGGAKPGKIGMGIFIVWPAFYTDVTDAYRLSRAGRLRTDLGGVYFNGIFALLTGAAYFITGYEPLLLLIPIQHAEILHQLLPFIRLDGYYVISDLAGVPDMASRIKPTLASLLPWKRAVTSVQELKPWVRAVVRVYVLTLVPVLLLFLTLLILNLPRMLATTWDSGRIEMNTIAHAFGGGDWLTVIVTSLELVLLVIIPVGTIITLAQLARRIGAGVWRATDGRPPARAAVIALAGAASAFAAISLAPSSVYRPIQPGEKGTLPGALRQLGELPSGRAALTPDRQRELGGGVQRAPAVGQSPARGVTPGVRAPGTSPAESTPTTPGTQPEVEAPRGSPLPSTPTAGPPAATLPTTSVPRATVPATIVSTPAATVPTPATTATLPAATVPVPALPVPPPATAPSPVVPVPTVSTPVPVPTTPTLPIP